MLIGGQMDNLSRTDVINKRQKLKSHEFYSHADMNAYFHIGNVRKKQEDGVLILTHPESEKFKLLAVADGMGGEVNGAKASNLALLKLLKWFERLPLNYYHNESKLCLELEQQLKEIDAIVRILCFGGGTTLALSIVCKNNTLFFNVGDTRIYIKRGTNFEQVSIDHSMTNELYQKRQIAYKDDMRFHRRNNIVTSSIGGLIPQLKISQSSVLTNYDYDGIMLFTDGVTDCLSDEQIRETIMCRSDDPKLSKLIVKKALSTDSVNALLPTNKYFNEIVGGKDNATALVLKRK